MREPWLSSRPYLPPVTRAPERAFPVPVSSSPHRPPALLRGAWSFSITRPLPTATPQERLPGADSAPAHAPG